MVLSGMSNMAQMEDNISFMKDFKTLTKEEFDACKQVAEIINQQKLIACTGCRYCMDGCPSKIAIYHPSTRKYSSNKHKSECCLFLYRRKSFVFPSLQRNEQVVKKEPKCYLSAVEIRDMTFLSAHFWLQPTFLTATHMYSQDGSDAGNLCLHSTFSLLPLHISVLRSEL